MHINTKRIILILTAAAAFTFTSCDDSTTGTEEPESEVEIEVYEDLNAEGDDGGYTFFSLVDGDIVASSDSASTNWDIAFRGTSILTNSGVSGPGEGGAVLLDLPFDDITIAPENGYSTDSDEQLSIPTGSGNGWYTYTGGGNPPHAVLPMDDVSIVLRTADGSRYAKLEIISYYEGNPDTGTEEFANTDTRPEGGIYTFRYAVQQTEGFRELQ